MVMVLLTFRVSVRVRAIVSFMVMVTVRFRKALTSFYALAQPCFHTIYSHSHSHQTTKLVRQIYFLLYL